MATAQAVDGVGLDREEVPITVETPLTIFTEDQSLNFDPYYNLEDGQGQKLSLSYSLSKKAIVNVQVLEYLSDGETKVIKSLVTNEEQSGNREYTVNWDGTYDLYPGKIASYGAYQILIHVVSGAETQQVQIPVNIVETGASSRVNATLMVYGEDRDQNGTVENQGYSDFVYQAKGTGSIKYYPPRDFSVVLSATGKQKVKQYVVNQVDIGYRKWFNQINFTAYPKMKWIGKNAVFWDNDTYEAIKTYNFSREIEAAIDQSASNGLSWDNGVEPTFTFYPKETNSLWTFHSVIDNPFEDPDDGWGGGRGYPVLQDNYPDIDEILNAYEGAQITEYQNHYRQYSRLAKVTWPTLEWAQDYDKVYGVIEETAKIFDVGGLITDREFHDPPGQMIGYSEDSTFMVKAPDGTRIDLEGAFTPSVDFYRTTETSRAVVGVEFNYLDYAYRKVEYSREVDFYHPITTSEVDESMDDGFQFNSYMLHALSDFDWGYYGTRVTPQLPSGVSESDLRTDHPDGKHVLIPIPQTNSNTGQVYFAEPICSYSYFWNTNLNWPDPENTSERLSDLLERDSSGKLVADYGGSGVSERTVTGTIHYGEEKRYPLIRDTGYPTGLLNLSSQNHLLVDAAHPLRFEANVSNEQSGVIIPEIDESNQELAVNYNSQAHLTAPWDTTYDPALETGKIQGRRVTDLSSYMFNQQVSIRDDYSASVTDLPPTNIQTATFVNAEDGVELNEYLTLDNWDIDLYYIDGTPNEDLFIDQVNLDTHSFMTKLKVNAMPKRLIPLWGNITGDFKEYRLYYFKKDETGVPIWHKVKIPQEYQGASGNEYVSIKEVNGAMDGIDNDQDGVIDEIEEQGVIGYLDAAGLNGVHSLVVQLTDVEGKMKNVVHTIQVGKIALSDQDTEITSSYNLATLDVPQGAVNEEELISITLTDLQHANLDQVGNLRPVGPVIQFNPAGLQFRSHEDGIDNDGDGETDEEDEDKRPTLRYRVPYLEYLWLKETSNDLNLYYLNSNGDLEVLNTAFVENTLGDQDDSTGYVEFYAKISHFSSFTLLDGADSLKHPILEAVQSPINQEFVELKGTATAGNLIQLYQSNRSGEFVTNDARELVGEMVVADHGQFGFPGVQLVEGTNYFYLVYADVANSPVTQENIVLDQVAPEIQQVTQSLEPYASEDQSLELQFNSSEEGTVIFSVVNRSGETVYQTEVEVQAGQNTLQWNGTNNLGQKLEDGVYQYQLRCSDLAGNYDTQKSNHQGLITIDNTDPLFSQVEWDSRYFSPNDDGQLDQVVVDLTISEPVSLKIQLLSQGADLLATLVDTTVDQKYTWGWNGLLNGTLLAEGQYQVLVEITDLAGNQSVLSESIILDITAPVLTHNLAADYYNEDIIPDLQVIEENPYQVEMYLNQQNYSNQTLIYEEDEYQLEVKVVDEAGNEAGFRKDFILDKTLPEISIQGIQDQQHVNEQVQLEIEVSDEYLDSQEIILNRVETSENSILLEEEKSYTLNVSAIDLAGNLRLLEWEFVIDQTPPVIMVGGLEDEGGYNYNLTPIIDIQEEYLQSTEMYLDEQQYVPGTEIRVNGEHELTIRAMDHAGNETFACYDFLIDKIKPFAPRMLTGTPGDRQVALNWDDNLESDLDGYNLYRDGVKINPELITLSEFLDTGLTNGVTYTYTVTALDQLGNESYVSEAIEATPGYDVTVTDESITYQPTAPYAGEEITLAAILENTGYVAFEDLSVFYYDGELGVELINEEIIPYLGLDEQQENSTIWSSLMGEYGVHEINIYADAPNDYPEINEEDNIATTEMYLAEPLAFEHNLVNTYPWLLIWGDGLSSTSQALYEQIDWPKKIILTKTQFLEELRSGKYNLVILPSETRPLNAPIYREIRENVYGGNMGILAINNKKAYHPILADLFGLYYKGKNPAQAVQLKMRDDQIICIPDQTLPLERVNVFGTTVGESLGDLYLIAPNDQKKKNEVIQQVELTSSLVLDGQSRYQITAELYDVSGNLLEQESGTIQELATEGIDASHSDTATVNLQLLNVTQAELRLGLENISDQNLNQIYQLTLNLKNLSTGQMVTISGVIDLGSQLNEGTQFGDLMVAKVRTDVVFPGVIANRYGQGRGMLFNFDLLETELTLAEQLKVMDQAIAFLVVGRDLDKGLVVGETIAVESTITSLVLPAQLKLTEILPQFSEPYNYSGGIYHEGVLDWFVQLEPDTVTTVKYHLQLPMNQGQHNVDSQIEYYHDGSYLFYKYYPELLELVDAEELIGELESMLSAYNQGRQIEQIELLLKDLGTLKSNPIVDVVSADLYVKEVVKMIDQLEDVESLDVEKIHQKLIQLMNIYQHQWYFQLLNVETN